MIDTNPLFEMPTDTTWSGHEHWGLRLRALKAQGQQTLQMPLAKASPLTAETTNEIVVFEVNAGGEDERLLSLSASEMLSAWWLCRTYERLPDLHLTNPAKYKPRQVESSKATAFSNLEARSLSDERLLEHFTLYFRRYFRPAYGKELADRIEQLEEMIRDEGGGPISGWSVGHLVTFLERNPSLLKPELVISPSGEVGAFWQSEREGEFSARFLTDGTVRFLLTTPNARHPQGADRSAGDTTTDQLFGKAGLGNLSWVTGG